MGDEKLLITQKRAAELLSVNRVTIFPGTIARTAGRSAAVDSEQPVPSVMSLAQGSAGRGALPRFERDGLTVFATLALTIAAVGIYGVISFMLNRRKSEFAWRSARNGATSPGGWFRTARG